MSQKPRRRAALPHPVDQAQGVAVRPPLDAREVDLVAGLAGAGPGVRRVWPGQPGLRSPWRPCERGCCLVADERPEADRVGWLRFLVREILAPRATVPRARAERLGLTGGHRLEGRILLDDVEGVRPRLLVASGRRVRVVEVDEVQAGEVVRMRSPGQSTER